MPSARSVRLWQATSGLLAAALAVALVLLATGGGRDDDPAGAIRAGVTLDEFEIGLPDHPLPARTPLRFDVSNIGDLPHDFVIDGIAATDVLAAGASTTLELGGLAPGVYRLHCDVDGHVEAGMAADLTIADGRARDHEH